MRNNLVRYGLLCMISMISLAVLTRCTTKTDKDNKAATSEYGGFKSQVDWGDHLVTVAGCNDCHTPKKMSPQGPVDDISLVLSGHPEQLPAPDVDRKEMEKKGLIVTNTLTVWIGPWGVSYAANLTPDQTGIGNWQESNFMTAIRQGKYKGIVNSRSLLPPMPWQSYAKMSDDELKAVFAYLKSLKSIKNVVPAMQPPALAGK